jgi:tRNA dimethylallyltransferase
MIIPVVCGTTSSGKSSYTFDLAKKNKHTNILSADSRQFYRDIPIVSGQDCPPQNITLFGQGILSLDEVSNIADYKKYASPIISKSIEENTPLIIVGGSGLYLKAITGNLTTTVVPPDEKFRSEAEKMSLEELQNLLKKTNPDKFNSLNNSDVNNPRRLIRHLEISRYNQSHSVIPDSIRNPDNIFSWIGLRKTSDQLAKDIHTRVITRLDQGAIEEVEKLLHNHPNQKLPIYTALGVKQIVEFIDGKIDKETLIKNWTQAEISYAKRQVVWFKKQPGIIWYDNN